MHLSTSLPFLPAPPPAQLQEAYSDRRAAINKCLQRVESDIDGLRAQRAKNRDDDSVAEKLSDASTKVWLAHLYGLHRRREWAGQHSNMRGVGK